jgi:hypothetical protein
LIFRLSPPVSATHRRSEQRAAARTGPPGLTRGAFQGTRRGAFSLFCRYFIPKSHPQSQGDLRNTIHDLIQRWTTSSSLQTDPDCGGPKTRMALVRICRVPNTAAVCNPNPPRKNPGPEPKSSGYETGTIYLWSGPKFCEPVPSPHFIGANPCEFLDGPRVLADVVYRSGPYGTVCVPKDPHDGSSSEMIASPLGSAIVCRERCFQPLYFALSAHTPRGLVLVVL